MIWPKNYFFYFGYDTIKLWSAKEIWPYLFGTIHLIITGVIIYLFKKRDLRVLGLVIFFLGLIPFLNILIMLQE